jgi:hypothetical protein
VGNPDDRRPPDTEPESAEATRDAAAQRIEQRRQNEKEISRREDEGYDQPQSSAQKTPNPGPQP